MKWATPSLSQARGDCIQAWVRAWARTPVSWSGVAWRTVVASSAPVSKGASSGSGRSRMVSWERGAWPSQPCRNGVTVAAAEAQSCDSGLRRSGRIQSVVLVAAFGLADGDKEAGSFKAEGRAVEAGCGDAGDFSAAALGLSDGERRGMAVDEGDGGRVAVRKLDGEAQAEARAGHAQLVLAHLVEDARAVAEDDGNAGGRVPDDVAEAAQAGEVDADRVPIGVEGDVARECR